MFDKNNMIIGYCLTAFGILTSHALHEFAHISFFNSVWFTVPSFLFTGFLGLWLWERSMVKSIREAQTPLETRTVPGVGKIVRFRDQWSMDTEVSDPEEGLLQVYLTLDADMPGPSPHQTEMIRGLKDSYPELKLKIINSLDNYFQKHGEPEALETLDFSSPSIHINREETDGDTEMEIAFETKDGSDMFYAAVIKGREVAEIYEGD